MKRLCMAFLLLPVLVFSQQAHPIIDSLKKQLTTVTTDKERVNLLGDLSQVLFTIDKAQSEVYAQRMMEVAEVSRDRKLIIRSLIINGRRYAMMGSFKESLNKAIAQYNEALALARQNKLDEEIAGAYLALSGGHRAIPDNDKALQFINEANSYVASLGNDSLKVAVFLEYGAVYTSRREKLLALRNFLAGLRLAEEMKHDKWLRQAYSSLSGFYASIEDYDRAIDYAVKAMEVRKKINDLKSPYGRVDDLTSIGNLYGYKKSHTMAVFYFEKAIQLADSLRFANLKMGAYMGLLNNYLYANQPQKALDFFNKSDSLKAYLAGFGYAGVIDQAYGYIYTDMKQFDSAYYYYAKAAPLFENGLSSSGTYAYYVQVGRLNKLSGRLPTSITYYEKAKELATQIGDLKAMQVVVKELDTLYQKTGNYERALHMASLNFQYRDSLETLGKEKDLMQIEVADEQARQERLAKAQQEQKEKRHRIQYMAITIAIAASFVLLAMTGFFYVSQTVIRLVGFFSFLMFFEFLFLLFKKNIAFITQGEPWKDLAFMIALAAILLPLHHMVEEKVIHYLTKRREKRLAQVSQNGFTIFRRTKKTEPAEV